MINSGVEQSDLFLVSSAQSGRRLVRQQLDFQVHHCSKRIASKKPAQQHKTASPQE